MSLQTRIFFAISAVAVLSAVGWLAFRGDEAPLPTLAAAIPAPLSEPAPAPQPAMPAAPPPRCEPTAGIPYSELTRVANARSEVIYTTSAMGEPMEVHPDGTVVIHNHRKVFTYADGRQEVRYARITAKPSFIPLSGIRVPEEDVAASK
jgi:hypothetical protein